MILNSSTESDGPTEYINASYIEVFVINLLDINKLISLNYGYTHQTNKFKLGIHTLLLYN